jgi:hypothetical protein
LDVEVVMDQETESAISALRQTGLHRCTSTRLACTSDACNQGREPCPTPTACQVPQAEPGSELLDSANAIVWAATLAVALLGVAAALFS